MASETKAAPAEAERSASTAEIRARVVADLGEPVADQLETAVKLVAAGSVEGAGERGVAAADALDAATETLCNALRAVPDKLVRSAGYAELLIAYGRALLVYVRKSALAQNVFGSTVQAEISKAAGASSNYLIVEDDVGDKEDVDGDDGAAISPSPPGGMKGADSAANESAAADDDDVPSMGPEVTGKKPHVQGEGNADAKAEVEEDKDGDEGEGEGEDEVTNEELAWEQFETARMVLEELDGAEGSGNVHASRLAAVYEALGDFLTETDGHDARAAEEYARAAAAEARAHGPATRYGADLHHRRYLTLRKDAPAEALAAMESAIASFRAFIETGEGDEQDKETLDLLIQDAAVYKSGVGASLIKTVVGFGKDAPAPTGAVAVANGGSEEITAVPLETAFPVTVKPKRRAVAIEVPAPALDDDPAEIVPGTASGSVKKAKLNVDM
jgi:hypothetical protein